MSKYKFYLIILFFLLLQSSIPAQNDWQLIGLENLTIKHVYVKGDTIWVATLDSLYQHEIYCSFTGGIDWIKIDNIDPLLNEPIILLRVNPYDILTLYGVAYNGRGWISTDGGNNWGIIFPEGEPWPVGAWVQKIYISPHNKDVLFGIITVDGQVDNLFRTTNGGENWENVSGFAASSHGVELRFAFDPVDSLKMYATGDTEFDRPFYVSYNFGENWKVISELSGSVNRIIVNPDNNNIIYRFAKPYRSIDGGYTWERIMGELIVDGLEFQPWIKSVRMNPINPNILYVSVEEWDELYTKLIPLGIYKTLDGGDNWEIMEGSDDWTNDYSLTNLFFDSLKQNLFVGSNHGLYRLSSIVNVKNEESYPAKYSLFQNYPNPFNPGTTINYEIPAAGPASNNNVYVELKVYDILGKEIATLVHQAQNPGKYEVDFNAKGLASGVYYYRLAVTPTANGAGLFVETKKMLLIK